jgi:hypothetical protein
LIFPFKLRHIDQAYYNYNLPEILKKTLASEPKFNSMFIEAVLAIQFFGGDGRKTQNSKENQIPFS